MTSLLVTTEPKECLDKNPLRLNVKAKTSGRPIRELQGSVNECKHKRKEKEKHPKHAKNSC